MTSSILDELPENSNEFQTSTPGPLSILFFFLLFILANHLIRSLFSTSSSSSPSLSSTKLSSTKNIENRKINHGFIKTSQEFNIEDDEDDEDDHQPQHEHENMIERLHQTSSSNDLIKMSIGSTAIHQPPPNFNHPNNQEISSYYSIRSNHELIIGNNNNYISSLASVSNTPTSIISKSSKTRVMTRGETMSNHDLPPQHIIATNSTHNNYDQNNYLLSNTWTDLHRNLILPLHTFSNLNPASSSPWSGKN